MPILQAHESSAPANCSEQFTDANLIEFGDKTLIGQAMNNGHYVMSIKMM